MPKVCIPIVEDDISSVVEKIHEYSSHADVIEVWLGELFQRQGLFGKEEIIEAIFCAKKENGNIPLLFTIKDEKEHGNFGGVAAEKKQLVLELFERGAEYVDVDYEFDEENDYQFLEELKDLSRSGKLILSAHFFEGTPSFPSLKNRVQLMQNRGAQIVKIAASPQCEKDLISILRLSENLSRNNIPFIVISMGEMGRISRIITPLMGGEMMFAPLHENLLSASGQISASQIREWWREFSWR